MKRGFRSPHVRAAVNAAELAAMELAGHLEQNSGEYFTNWPEDLLAEHNRLMSAALDRIWYLGRLADQPGESPRWRERRIRGRILLGGKASAR